MTVMFRSQLPLPLLRVGKVREVYEAGPDHLLLVASDRISAFVLVTPKFPMVSPFRVTVAV